MNRKDFLSVAIPASMVLGAGSASGANVFSSATAGSARRRVPPYLAPGDVIGITSPAGFISLEDIQPAVKQMESWGLRVQIGETIGKRDFSFGGTDAERLSDFQQMLDNPEIKAIMCARGGYGAIRITDQLNFSSFRSHPKWIIGFSDITVLHCHISRNFGIASIHSKMCNSFPADWSLAEPIQVETILSIRKALFGEQLRYTSPVSPANRMGAGEGVLIGGNLRTIENLGGTVSQPDTRKKILFVEDTGEYLYSVDRMFWNLKRTGQLEKLAGLIVGGFKLKVDTPPEEFSKTLYEIVMEKVQDYNYPVCFDFPVGHQKNNFALKCGVKHRLEVGDPGGVLVAVE